MNLVEAIKAALFNRGSDVTPTPRNVSGLPAVWYAVNKISSNFGVLPFQPMMRLPDDRGAVKAKDHSSYRPCKKRSNRYQSSVIFREMMAAHCLLWGNGRAAIVGNGREYIPLMPDRTLTFMVEGEKYHATKPADDDRLKQYIRGGGDRDEIEGAMIERMISEPQKAVVLHDSDVLHLQGFGFDGISGESITSIARNTFETQLHAVNHAKVNYRDGFKGELMLEAPVGAFRKEGAAKEFLDQFNKAHSGSDRKEKSNVGLLREGVTAKVLSMSGRDAQWVEQGGHQRQDIALLFMLEAIMGDDTSVSYNSLEQKTLVYLFNCLMKFLVKWEQECEEKLTSDREKADDSIFYKFNTAAILRSDFATTMSTLSIGIAARILNRNEARALIDMNAVDGGDEFENPAIDVATGSDPDDQDSDTPDESDPTQARAMKMARAAIVGRIGHLIGVECRRVTEGTTSQNYLEWLDDFYASWERKLHFAIDELSDWDENEFAAVHCAASRVALVEASGRATKDTLRATVEEVTNEWHQRAETLADWILKGDK